MEGCFSTDQEQGGAEDDLGMIQASHLLCTLLLELNAATVLTEGGTQAVM